MSKISNEDLISEIHYLYTIFNEVPSSTQMDNHGEYSAATYLNRFGSWSNALKQAGYPGSHSSSDIPRMSLINEIHHLYNKLGRIPSDQDMEEYGVYNPDQYLDLFINWPHVIQESDIKTDGRSNKEVPVKDLIAEIGRLYKINKTVPTIKDVTEDGKYSIGPYINTFSSWNNAVEIAGFEPTKPGFIPNEELLSELRRLNEEVDGNLSSTQMNKFGKYSGTSYIDRFGSWNQALQAADINKSEIDE